MTPIESILLEALEKIAHPLKYLHEVAKRDGAKLDGRAAIELSTNANWLQSIATEAIKKWEDSSGKETGMKWVKASERLPQYGKKVWVKHTHSNQLAEAWVKNDVWYSQLLDGEEYFNYCFSYETGEEPITEWLDESVPPYKEEVDKEDELWNEVMQEMGFYSSQLDNIKSKFHLTRKV